MARNEYEAPTSSGAPRPARDPARRASASESDLDRRRRRAALLADIAAGRELRDRLAPRRARLRKTRAAFLHRVFRFDPPPRRIEH